MPKVATFALVMGANGCRAAQLNSGVASMFEDWHWLTSGAADEWLTLASAEIATAPNPDRMLHQLRKSLTPSRASLVIEQAQLRLRAKSKFRFAEKMYFTSKGLEQATSELMAEYKSQRFRQQILPQAKIADLCCGVGGDSLSLLREYETMAIDSDAISLLCLEANARQLGLRAPQCVLGTATDFNLTQVEAWHIDPDRRPQGARVSDVDFASPTWDELNSMVRANRNVCLKLAPAARLPHFGKSDIYSAPSSLPSTEKLQSNDGSSDSVLLPQLSEQEFIGDSRECKQQLLWHGSLVQHAGARIATTLASSGQVSRLIATDADTNLPASLARTMGRFVCEPSPSIIAAGLVNVFAFRLGLKRVASHVAYLVGCDLPNDPQLTVFEVIDESTFDAKRVKQMLSRHDVGRFDIKKRGISNEIAQRLASVKLTGSNSATLILLPIAGEQLAVLTKRIH
jgi:THUMP domain-like